MQVNIPAANRTTYDLWSEIRVWYLLVPGAGLIQDAFGVHAQHETYSRTGSCEFITLDAQFPGVSTKDKLVAAF